MPPVGASLTCSSAYMRTMAAAPSSRGMPSASARAPSERSPIDETMRVATSWAFARAAQVAERHDEAESKQGHHDESAD